LKACLSSPERARALFESLDIAVRGYDADIRELFEIPEVREYVSRLDAEFPYWLFFLAKDGLGLQFIMHCFMPPHLTEEARRRIVPERLNQLLTKRWFPAMNRICEAVGFSECQIEALTSSSTDYFVNGPRRTASGQCA
jgi:hypothetical protein